MRLAFIMGLTLGRTAFTFGSQIAGRLVRHRHSLFTFRTGRAARANRTTRTTGATRTTHFFLTRRHLFHGSDSGGNLFQRGFHGT